VGSTEEHLSASICNSLKHCFYWARAGFTSTRAGSGEACSGPTVSGCALANLPQLWGQVSCRSVHSDGIEVVKVETEVGQWRERLEARRYASEPEQGRDAPERHETWLEAESPSSSKRTRTGPANMS
jgi:hypothetical protein